MVSAHNREFKKRVFTMKVFVEDFFYLLFHFPHIIKALFFTKTIDKKFRERIMTVVTRINGCTYCAWFHTHVSLRSGIPQNDLKEIMDMQFGTSAEPYEMTALVYAQHFTETNRNPDPDMEEKLLSTYGEHTANAIKLLIRIMFFTNLQGNTFDAFVSRMQGKPAHDSNLLFEFAFFVVNIPLVLPAILVKHLFPAPGHSV